MRYFLSKIYKITSEIQYDLGGEIKRITTSSFVCAQSADEAIDGYTCGNGMERDDVLWWKIEVITYSTGVTVNNKDFKELKKQK